MFVIGFLVKFYLPSTNSDNYSSEERILPECTVEPFDNCIGEKIASTHSEKGEWKNDKLVKGEYREGDLVLIGRFDPDNSVRFIKDSDGTVISNGLEYKGKIKGGDGKLPTDLYFDNFFFWIDNISGYGEIKYTTGGKYVGEVMYGMRHGEGEHTFPDGESWKGRWEHDTFLDHRKVGDTIDIKDTFVRDDTLYRKFTDEPFTGRVVGQSQGMIRKGKGSGILKKYYESGELEIEALFIDGLGHGGVVQYHKNGKKAMTGNYRNDKRDGCFHYYKDDGSESKDSECYEDGVKLQN